MYFTQLGSFPKLQAALGNDPDHEWTEEEQRRFLANHYYFAEEFRKLGGGELNISTADAMLEWLKVYSFSQIREMSTLELNRSLEAMWSEIQSIGSSHIEVHTKDVSVEAKDYRNKRL